MAQVGPTGRASAAAVSVRSVVPDDDLDALNSGNALWLGAEQERRTVASVPAESGLAAILVGELEREAVACAVAVAAPGAAFGYGFGRLYVQPLARRRGVGGAVFAHMCEMMRRRGLPGMMLAVDDTEADGLAAARAAGLVEHGHHVESLLDLADPPPVPACAPEVVLETLPDDADDDLWRDVFSFFAARLDEAPDSREGGGNMPYEVFRSFLAEPWQVLLAREAGSRRPVGITSLMRRADAPSRLNTMFTGVHPNWRRRGLSTALKAEHARQVRAAGWSEILTQNMDGNAPILAANRRLNFRPVGGYRDVGLAL